MINDQGPLGRNEAVLGQYGATQVSPKKARLTPDKVRGKDLAELQEELGTSWPQSDLEARQMKRELESWTAGYDKMMDGWTKAKQDGDAMRASPSRRLVEGWMIPLAEAIEKDAEKAQRTRGKKQRWLMAYGEIGSTGMAYRALAATLRKIISFRAGEGAKGRPLQVNALAFAIGDEVTTAVRLAAWKRLNPALYAAFEKRLDEAGATPGHRAVVMKIGLERKARQGERATPEMMEATAKWTLEEKAGIGLWLVLTVEKVIQGFISVVRSNHAVKRRGVDTRLDVVPSEEVLQWIEKAVEHQSLLQTVHRAMVAPPLPWSGGSGGGYLLGVQRRLMPRHGGSELCGDAEQRLDTSPPMEHLGVVNSVQAVPYILNREVWLTASVAFEHELPLEGLPTSYREAEPPKPPESADPATFASWRRVAGEVKRRNAKLHSRAVQSAVTLGECESLKDETAFWFPGKCDFRGRMYWGTSTVSPQGDDLRRSLLLFAEGMPIGDGPGPEALAAQVAKAFGKDKLSWAERVAWTYANEELVRKIAEEPLTHRQEWEKEADVLWGALAACAEWDGYRKAGPGFITRLPCYIDGTCNGIQHFAALARAPDMARIVNLEPGERPHDIYQVVADRAYELVIDARDRGAQEEHRAAELWLRLLGDRPPRTLAKKIVMVKPYGGQMTTTLDEVQTFWDEAGGAEEWSDVPDLRDRARLRGWLGKKLTAAIGSRVGAADEIMSWLQKSSALMTKEGCIAGAIWETPSGWPWVNAYLQRGLSRVEVTVSGDRRSVRLYKYQEGKADGSRQRSSVSPNFVHALDASALVRGIRLANDAGVKAITAIHDSVGGLAPQMPVLGMAIRQGFVDTHLAEPLEAYREAVLEALPSAEAKAKLPSLPYRGSFDVRKVLDSEYFFC